MDLAFKLLSILTAITLIHLTVSNANQNRRLATLEHEAKEDRITLREHIKWGEERSQKILDGIERIASRVN